MSEKTIAERLNDIDTKLTTLLTNTNTQLTSKGKEQIRDLGEIPNTVSELKNPTGTINIVENGNVDVSNYATANVNVASSGGKNVQFNNQMHVTTYAAYSKGIEITVTKTGLYKVTREFRRMDTSGTWGSQLYINGVAYGTANETWGMDYYMNYNTSPNTSSEWQKTVEEHISLQEGDVIATYGKSRANSNWLYHVYLLIEEE